MIAYTEMFGETRLSSMYLILQLASAGVFSWRGPREKLNRNTQSLSRPMSKGETPSLALHFTGQRNSQGHLRSKGQESRLCIFSKNYKVTRRRVWLQGGVEYQGH